MSDNSKGSGAGSLKISHDVVASIAGYTATEIQGVAGLASISTNLAGWLWEKQIAKPVTVTISDGVAVIDISLVIRSGVKIPAVSKQVQAAVKEAVQNMTGIVVSRVNLHISGIHFADSAAV